MEILRGVQVANAITEELQNEQRNWTGALPHLAIIRVGKRPDDLAYERGATKRMEKIGFLYSTFYFPDDITDEAFQEEFDKINDNPDIDGILLLRPLPKHLNEKSIEERIDPRKDIDGISPINLAKVFAGDESGYAPCTAEAVIAILEHKEIDLTGKRVTVIGRSLVIGKPVSMLLMKKNATVTICHTRTKDMPSVCKNAEILVAAAGQPKMVNSSYVGKDAVVIDVGINVDEEGNLCGDVNLEDVKDYVSIITPVPGGVGSVTTSILAKHLMRAAKER